MLKLNLGCGRKLKDGYVNIDIQRSHKATPDVIADCRHLPYDDCSVDVIESYHLLEHMGFQDAIESLRHWYNLLVRNGMVIMELPDLEQDMVEFLNGNLEMIHSIFGRQRNEHDYHKYGYTKTTMEKLLRQIGFSDVVFEQATDYHAKSEPCMRVVAIKK